MSIVDAVLLEYIFYHSFVNFSKRDRAGEMKSTRFLRLDYDVRFFLVKSDSSYFELAGEFFLVLFSFLCVKHHYNEISRLADCYNLSSATFARGGAFNDPW